MPPAAPKHPQPMWPLSVFSPWAPYPHKMNLATNLHLYQQQEAVTLILRAHDVNSWLSTLSMSYSSKSAIASYFINKRSRLDDKTSQERYSTFRTWCTPLVDMKPYCLSRAWKTWVMNMHNSWLPVTFCSILHAAKILTAYLKYTRGCAGPWNPSREK